MQDDSGPGGPAESGAFAFHGTWRQFAPIAFTNLLLTIVTLGIYSFWARTRVRKYLWSQTRFIDDRLEWTGTGLELFIGYIMALILVVLPLVVLQLVLQGVLLNGHPGAAVIIVIALYGLLMYLVGVAIFRALRYRLTRTFWHGIRGGSDDQGLAFGWQYLWRTIAGSLAAGLLIPWSMTSLWNERWNTMSFGPLRFDANAQAGGITLRFLLFYLVPIMLVVAVGVAGVMFGGFGGFANRPPAPGSFFYLIALFFILFYGILGGVALFFYSAYFREVIGTLKLGELEFEFTARTMDWVKLMLGSIGLVIITLGIGYIFLPYRNWAFFIRHLKAYGEVRIDELTQSSTRELRQGEGLLDAFDVGAF